MHRGGVVLVLVVLLLWPAVLTCQAAEEMGTIRVILEPEMADSLVVLHSVGILRGDGMEVDALYGGGYVTQADLQTRELARWLSDRAEGGTEKQISREGTVMFSGLSEGVYLLKQREGSPGYYAMDPVLISIPEGDGSWYVRICPAVEEKVYRVPKTGWPVTPVLGAMGMVLSAYCIGIWYENWHKQRRK